MKTLSPGESHDIELKGTITKSTFYNVLSTTIHVGKSKTDDIESLIFSNYFEMVECHSDRDCDENEYCKGGQCSTIDCYGGYIKNHKCVKDECYSDSDCNSDYECKDNKCVRKPVITIPTTTPTTISATQSQGVSTWLMELVIIILLAIIAVLLARRK